MRIDSSFVSSTFDLFSVSCSETNRLIGECLSAFHSPKCNHDTVFPLYTSFVRVEDTGFGKQIVNVHERAS